MKYLLLAILVLALGCDVNPSKMGDGEAADFAGKITYVKDGRTGLCFALVVSRKTGSTTQSGMGMSDVLCDAVAKYLVKNK